MFVLTSEAAHGVLNGLRFGPRATSSPRLAPFFQRLHPRETRHRTTEAMNQRKKINAAGEKKNERKGGTRHCDSQDPRKSRTARGRSADKLHLAGKAVPIAVVESVS